MTTIGVFNIITKNSKILLVKRRDLPFWDLPGGGLESGETLEECLIRETFEETGLIVSNCKQILHFINTSINDEQFIFSSTIVGGKPISDGPETRLIKYFPLDSLPLLMIPHRKIQISSISNSQKKDVYYVKDSLFLTVLRKIF
ncbi:NUDIX domain-containing protein [Enterococcus sp. DIV1390a]|uniref:NUDIX domain-containing protein n=1 Tax=Enterococcus sp. DIV1390a TaxID=2774970 RepID=UPI003F1F0EF9